MRFLSAFLLCTLAAVSCVESQPRPPLVLLVHGRGHLEDDTATLRRSWKRDLDVGLERAGIPPLTDSLVRLAWYADVMDPSAEVGCERALRTTDSLGFQHFARDLLGALANSLPRNESREAR